MRLLLVSLFLVELAAAAKAPHSTARPGVAHLQALSNRTRAILRVAERAAHMSIILVCVGDSLESVRTDEWSVIRKQPATTTNGRGRIMSQRRRAAQFGKLVGGYTPRIVFLAGLMLRSLQMATKFRRFFDPSLGYSAGAVAAASFSKREWLKTILLGWGVGGVYWAGFRVEPPPSL